MTTRTMTNKQIREILLRLKKDRKMSDIEWHKFCKRYATRDVSTVIWLLTRNYGNMPKGIGEQIKQELQTLCSCMHNE